MAGPDASPLNSSVSEVVCYSSPVVMLLEISLLHISEVLCHVDQLDRSRTQCPKQGSRVLGIC